MAETEKARKRSGIERVLGQSIGVDPEQCGLLLLAGPVGAGKTYSSMSHIADQLIALGPKCRRFVFVTNVKRNLPVDELLQILDERGHPELAAYVVKLDSNLGMFQSNINAAKGVMPSAPFSYWKKGPKKPGSNERAVIKAEFNIRNLPELQEAERLQRILEETRNLPLHVGAARRKAIEGAEEEAEKAESKLRRYISSVFASMCKLDEGGYRLMTRQEKRELVEQSAWWEWLRVLYPSVLTHKKRVLFMSVNKLLVKNSPIIEPSESIWESDLLRGSVVIIDEFELSKSVINDFLIRESVGKMADMVSMFRMLMGRALEGRQIDGKGGDGNAGAAFTSELFRSPSDNIGCGPKLRAEFNGIVSAAEEAYLELHLDKQFRLSDRLHYKNQPFLFNDFQSHIVDVEDSSWSAIRFLESQNTIEFGSGTPPYAVGETLMAGLREADSYSVPLLLSRLEGLVRWIVSWIARVAENYQAVVAEDADQGKRPEISFDQAVGTVLSELNMMDEVHGESNPARRRVIEMAHEERARRAAADDGATDDDPADLSLYRKGFSVHAFTESAQHDTLTRMERCALSCTAERKLIELSRRNFVVGISASLDIPSVLGNYDIEHIKAALGDRCIMLDADQRQGIEEDYQRSVSRYNNVEIRVSKVFDVDPEGEYGEKAWLSVFDDAAVARKAFNKVAMDFSADDGRSTFGQRRVLKVCAAFKGFWEADDAHAMLCVLNALPKAGGGEFDLLKLKDMFGMVFEQLGIDGNVDDAFCVLGGGNEEFERAKKQALSRLAAGEKLFVITAYQPAGAGQNLQYKIPEGVTPVQINDRPASGEMDFDCLYVEAPTHTSPVITGNEKVDEYQVVHHILGCEYLYENAEISRGALLRSVSEALRALGGSGLDYGYKETDSARLFGAKQVYQAVGRLSRTNMKMPVIRLFADARLVEGVPLGVLRSCGLTFTPEFGALVDAFDEPIPQPSKGVKRLQHRAARASDRSRACINSLLGSGWRDDARKAWFDLGNQVLKYPTLPDGWSEVPYMERCYYVELDAKRTSYRYTAKDDFASVEVLFDPPAGAKSFEVSEKAARLDVLMRIPGMRSYFEQCGYATKWEASTRIMTPIVAESIFKGRLGEVCGRFVLEQSGIAVADIDDAFRFEKFDFVLPGTLGDQQVFIDFKHWKKQSDRTGWDSEKLIDWVFAKMEAIDAKKAIVANVLPPDEGDYRETHRSKDGRRLLVVPALVKGDCSFDETAIQAIRRFADGIVD